MNNTLKKIIIAIAVIIIIWFLIVIIFFTSDLKDNEITMSTESILVTEQISQ